MVKTDFMNKYNNFNESWGLGNYILYDLCEKCSFGKSRLHNIQHGELCGSVTNSLFTDENLLASQMWLIGRLYAASPERYKYKNTIKKPKWNDDGYETFFEDIAKRITGYSFSEKNDTEQEKRWRYFVEKLNNAKQNYRSGYSLESEPNLEDGNNHKKIGICKHDQERMEESIILVFYFLEMLRTARSQRDESLQEQIIANPQNAKSKYDNENLNAAKKQIGQLGNKSTDYSGQSYPVSFCSKFLHFHLPWTVFIVDSITISHLKNAYLEELIKNSDSKEDPHSVRQAAKNTANDIVNRLTDSNGIISKIFDGFPKDILDKKGILRDKLLSYTHHCVLEYEVARRNKNEINNENDSCLAMIPRIVDVKVSNVKRNLSKEKN